jgi:hypothetical protein
MRTWNVINNKNSDRQYLFTTLHFPHFNPTLWTLRQNAYFPLQDPRTFTPLISRENKISA